MRSGESRSVVAFREPSKEQPMTGWRNRRAGVAGVIVVGLVVAACASGKKAETAARATAAEGTGSATAVGIKPGVAGGASEETTTATVTLSALDVDNRRVTLVDDAGNKVTLNARPEIRNLNQFRAGDRITATIKKRLEIVVGAGGGEPHTTYNAAVTPTKKGDRPGEDIAETYESVAAVTAIDRANRTATLEFADGRAHTVPVRTDVDLTRYKVGDSVTVRVTSTLSVLASR